MRFLVLRIQILVILKTIRTRTGAVRIALRKIFRKNYIGVGAAVINTGTGHCHWPTYTLTLNL
jgi:hypothetical protein